MATDPQTLIRAYPCGLCDSSFATKKERQRHRLLKHPEELQMMRAQSAVRKTAWRKYLEPENWHPAANIMPMSSQEDFQRMVEDIRVNGLRVPVVLYKDKVLDGRNRLKACDKADVVPEFVNLEGEVDPISWVLSTNMSRRHLNASQVTAVLLDAEDLIAKLKADATARRTAGTNLKELVPEGQVRDLLGALGGVSGRYIGEGKHTRQFASPEEWESIRRGDLSLRALSTEIKRTRHCRFCSQFFQSERERDEHAVKTHETMCLICEQKFASELLLKLHRVREHEPIEGVCTAGIQSYYQSDLGNIHPHGKDCGGLRGCGTVYRFSRTDVVWGHLEGFILLQQNKNDCRIVRLIAQDWNVEIGQSLLLHVLAHHQNVYALLDNSDIVEYRRMYEGLMHEVSRKHIGEPAVLQIPAGFAWTKEACLQILKDNANVYRAFVENAEELGVECNSGGKIYSAEETRKKLKKDIELASRKLWLLRPNVQVRYQPPLKWQENPVEETMPPASEKPADAAPTKNGESSPVEAVQEILKAIDDLTARMSTDDKWEVYELLQSEVKNKLKAMTAEARKEIKKASDAEELTDEQFEFFKDLSERIRQAKTAQTARAKQSAADKEKVQQFKRDIIKEGLRVLAVKHHPDKGG